MIPSLMAQPGPEPEAPKAPPLHRRLACFLYEGVLLFGVVMAAGFVYGTVTQQRHALVGTWGLQTVIFVVLGLYFVHSWSGKGQTLAMQTWHIRLVGLDGAPVTRFKALCRYLLSWLWFLPALVGVQLAGLKGPGATFTAMAAGVLAYAGLAWLHPKGQYLHDELCGTRLIPWAAARRA
jgi:uncharacterized RDD family membrane protein YckC